MAGYGWSYLTVTHVLDGTVWRTTDAGTFDTEDEMFRELGLTGWELVGLREHRGNVIYYFKRPRA
jgi:hypothetical protein